MTAAPFTITADTLHAYVDGQLGEAERLAVEHYLAGNPTAAAEVAGWTRQNEAIEALFAPAGNEAVPARLKPRTIAHELRSARAQSFRNIAAAIVLVVLGSGIGWYGRDVLLPAEAASDRLIDEAVTAHALYVKEQLHAVEAPADSPNLMRWLSNRIATPIDAPDLTAQGFRFIGARLLPGSPNDGAPGPAAQLMYENAAAERLTLYITAALPDRKEVWRLVDRNGITADYWANDAITCTIVSDLSDVELKTMGKAIYEQLTRRPDSSWNPKS
ncbi:MAG: anti-sigma factor [Devosia sp.]